MDKSEKHEPQSQTDAAMETLPITRTRSAASDLPEDAGNCRQSISQELSLHLLSDSLFSERQKLRHVLDLADSFIRSSSEVCHEFCRADSLIQTDVKHRGTEKRSPEHPPAAKYYDPVSCAAGGNEVFEGRGSLEKVWQRESSNYNYFCRLPFPYDLHFPFSFSPAKDEETWPQNGETENMKNMELQLTTKKQTPSQNNCITSRLQVSNQRLNTDISLSSTNQTLASDDEKQLIKESTSSGSTAIHKMSTVFGAVSTLKPLLKSNDFTDMIPKTAGAQSKGVPENQKEVRKAAEEMEDNKKEKIEDDRIEQYCGKMHEEQESHSDLVVHAQNKTSHSELETIPVQMAKSAHPSSTCHLKLPSNLTIYEQYQLCVDQLHHLRITQRQHIKSACFTQSPEKERKTSEETAGFVPASFFEVIAHIADLEINNQGHKRVTHAEKSPVTSKISKYNRNGTKMRGHGETEYCDNLTVNKTPANESRRLCQKNNPQSAAHLDLNSKKHGDFKQETAGDKVVNTPTEILRTKPGDFPPMEESATLTANTGSLQKKIRRHPDRKGHQRTAKGQKRRTEARGARTLCENSSISSSGGILPSNQAPTKYTKKINSPQHRKRPDNRMKDTQGYRDTHTTLQLSEETHTLHHDDPRPVRGTAEHVGVNNNGCKYSPADILVIDHWLCLPDEVWLSILSRVCHRDLCRVVQVCRRLYTLATDHMLWKNIRIENSTLTNQWLLFVGRHRPRSLCLSSCSGLSVTSCGLESFFSLCRNTLEELKVTSCTGSGLHGDCMLRLIGQLCDHVTNVDVSWSGASDTGVRGLSYCGKGVRLKSVVLNGCHVTDVPLKELIMRHKESLCRLEVFGCQFLTPSCLQTVYKMCQGLQHLNIGLVPKVNVQSLTVMPSHLKCLISLNLTGLQGVNDATVDTLLQNSVELQSLTFSSCPGVTDMTLHSISKYTPCIRSLNVSGCKAVTDAGVQSLALGCRRLQQLDLSTTGTGNRGVSLLANYCSKHLYTVKLSFCHITSEKIVKLCRRCRRLKVLHLYGCAQLPTEREIREANTSVKVYPQLGLIH
ncbi:uncharacterized protein [Embiotoca jacksoni]|uniref:uncharacterized protein n=1 Tax=Embiotoca jacksoni TaxID=100190 RepID=UPI003703A75D